MSVSLNPDPVSRLVWMGFRYRGTFRIGAYERFRRLLAWAEVEDPHGRGTAVSGGHPRVAHRKQPDRL